MSHLANRIEYEQPRNHKSQIYLTQIVIVRSCSVTVILVLPLHFRSKVLINVATDMLKDEVECFHSERAPKSMATRKGGAIL